MASIIVLSASKSIDSRNERIPFSDTKKFVVEWRALYKRQSKNLSTESSAGCLLICSLLLATIYFFYSFPVFILFSHSLFPSSSARDIKGNYWLVQFNRTIVRQTPSDQKTQIRHIAKPGKSLSSCLYHWLSSLFYLFFFLLFLISFFLFFYSLFSLDDPLCYIVSSVHSDWRSINQSWRVNIE